MSSRIQQRLAAVLFGGLILEFAAALHAQPLPLVRGVELQPLSAQVERVVQALELAGSPLDRTKQEALKAALAEANAATALEKIQQVLDPLCLAAVQINPESRVKVQAGPAPKELIEQGWRVFLVKVHNEAGVTAPLRCQSPNAERMHDTDNSPEPPAVISPARCGEPLDGYQHVHRGAAERAAFRPAARVPRGGTF